MVTNLVAESGRSIRVIRNSFNFKGLKGLVCLEFVGVLLKRCITSLLQVDSMLLLTRCSILSIILTIPILLFRAIIGLNRSLFLAHDCILSSNRGLHLLDLVRTGDLERFFLNDRSLIIIFITWHNRYMILLTLLRICWRS